MSLLTRVFRTLALAAFASFFSGSLLTAQIIVNPPQPLTHRVQVQPIRVGGTPGNFAVTFGPPGSEAYIKEQINLIWAQLGVRIDWLPMNDYLNDFAYGDPDLPPADPLDRLETIVDNAGVPPKNPNAIVLNLFFVGHVPGSGHASPDAITGLAFIDANGIALQVGGNLPASPSGRDAIATVIAHEIGHNLGLSHSPPGSDNLMSEANAVSQRLYAGQKSIIFSNQPGIDGFDFLQPLPPHPNYALWAETHQLAGGPSDDDDHDGIPNLVEFMLGLDPKAFSSLPPPALSPDGLTWTLPKRRPALDDGFLYRVETSSGLSDWLAAGAPDSGSVVLADDASHLSVRLAPHSSSRFLRLNVPVPPDLLPTPAALRLPDEPPVRRVPAACGCGSSHIR